MQIAEMPKALILTPGASADRDHPSLRLIESALPELHVERLTLATTSVPAAVKKIVQAGEILARTLRCEPEQIAYGGRSFGGRACSVAVADGLAAAGLVLLSYPLHPPGKPDSLRVDHFPGVSVPCLFVTGDKDPFGSAAEFKKHLRRIKSPVSFHQVRGNHSPKNQDDVIVGHIREFLAIEN